MLVKPDVKGIVENLEARLKVCGWILHPSFIHNTHTHHLARWICFHAILSSLTTLFFGLKDPFTIISQWFYWSKFNWLKFDFWFAKPRAHVLPGGHDLHLHWARVVRLQPLPMARHLRPVHGTHRVSSRMRENIDAKAPILEERFSIGLCSKISHWNLSTIH